MQTQTREKKYQLLARILPNLTSQNAISAAEDLFTTATRKNFLITKLKVFESTLGGEESSSPLLVVIFETEVKQDEKFPGVFSVHRRAATESYYTLNALEAARRERNVERDEQLFDELRNTLLTLHDEKLIAYRLEKLKSYVRHGGSYIALR